MKKLLLLFVFIPFLSTSQVWDQVSSFIDDGRHHPITFGNDEFGFVISGSFMDEVYKYDKLNDIWIQMQNIPFSGRGYSYGVSIANKAYMGFGTTSNNTFPTDWWEYDMNNDSWIQLANFPGDGRQHPAMIVVNNNIYMGCGGNGNGNLGDWWEYNITLNTWIQKSNIIGNNRHHPYYFGIGDYAYVGFGHGSLPGPGNNSSLSTYIYNDFYRYDPSNDSWLQLADFPSEARVAGTQFSYNGKGYILSGDGDDHQSLTSGEFWEYNPANDSWSQLPSHPGGAIWAPGNFVIGCDVYFLLGQDWNTNMGLYPTSVYKYKLSEDCGCTDSLAYNYSNISIADDGSCCYASGCMDPYALNYDSLSCFDDGSCISPILGCTNPLSSNFDPNANTNIAFGGALDNSFGTGSFFNGDQYLKFDASKESVIKSAVIYAQNNNTITFELRDNNATVIQDVTLSIVAGEQRISLDFEVPIGTNFQLGVSASNSGLFRNNSNVNYPYDIGSAITITGSSANTNPLDFYYFYYDLEIEIECYDDSNESWDCNVQDGCFDTGDGLGEFSTLAECELQCLDVSVNNIHNSRKLLRVTDFLGRNIKEKSNISRLIYLYDDGTVEKRIIFE